MAGRWRGLIVPGIAAGLAFAVLMLLGFWQVERLRWKEALIARVAARIDAPAIVAPGPQQWPELVPAEFEYQPATVSGHFLHQFEAHLFTVLASPRGPLGGLGYFILTPLETADGWFVYVNRGFVPEGSKDTGVRLAGQTDGEVTVTGLLRAPRPAAWFSADDDPSSNVWLSRNPDSFAKWSGLPTDRIAPYTLDVRFDPDLAGGLPQGGETLINFPNNHLGYALTWFGLAAGLAGVFLVFARSRLRGDR